MKSGPAHVGCQEKTRIFSALLNACIRIVIVDALLVESVYPKPDDPLIVLKSNRDITNDIFDEGRFIVSLHGHVTLVFSF